MTVRFTITIPDEVNGNLQRWADKQGRTKADLAATLIEDAVRKAKQEGEIQANASDDAFTELKGFLKCLAETLDTDGFSTAYIAQILGIPEQQLDGMVAVVQEHKHQAESETTGGSHASQDQRKRKLGNGSDI